MPGARALSAAAGQESAQGDAGIGQCLGKAAPRGPSLVVLAECGGNQRGGVRRLVLAGQYVGCGQHAQQFAVNEFGGQHRRDRGFALGGRAVDEAETFAQFGGRFIPERAGLVIPERAGLVKGVVVSGFGG